jgi:hypothetical protein
MKGNICDKLIGQNKTSNYWLQQVLRRLAASGLSKIKIAAELAAKRRKNRHSEIHLSDY